MNRNERRAQQLGMPHGTANNKLKKQLLFKYVVMARDNICFKCGETIDSVDELSIEHKEPWEGRDTSLFWDLNNITFSHLVCNTPHTNRAEKLRKSTVGSNVAYS
jgi:5-methylcytosine-specific restriction endonuclease McrA